MITMTVIAKVKPQKQQEFLQALHSLYGSGEERKEEGLKKSTLYQEVNEPTGFRLVAEWESQKDLERYLRAEEFRVLLGALGVLCKESEIRYSEKMDDVPDVSKIQVLLPETSWRRNLAMMQEEGKDVLEEKKEKYP